MFQLGEAKAHLVPLLLGDLAPFDPIGIKRAPRD